MFDDIDTLLTNPDRFFESRERDPSLTEPTILVLSIALLSAIAVAAMILAFVDAVPGELQIFLVFGGIVGGAFAVASPFINWLLYAAAFHVITYFFDGDGGFRDTFALTGWGFAPSFFSAIVSLVITVYVTQAIQPPTDPAAFQSYSTRIAGHPLNLAASGIGVLFTLWSAYIWVPAVRRARNVTRRQAIVAVAVPVLFGILLTVAGVLFSGIAQGSV